MDNDYSKNVDTHIRELQEEDKGSNKFIILCFIMMSLGSLILFIFNFFNSKSHFR